MPVRGTTSQHIVDVNSFTSCTSLCCNIVKLEIDDIGVFCWDGISVELY